VPRKTSRFSNYRLQLFNCSSACAQDTWGRARQRQDGGFHSNRAWTSIQYHINGAAKLLCNMLCVCGADIAKWIALGAAIPHLDSFIKAKAAGWPGTRIATVSSPAVTISGTPGLFSTISVSGPGQNRCIRSSADCGNLHIALQSGYPPRGQ